MKMRPRNVRKRAVASPIDEARAARRHGNYLRKTFSKRSQESGWGDVESVCKGFARPSRSVRKSDFWGFLEQK